MPTYLGRRRAVDRCFATQMHSLRRIQMFSYDHSFYSDMPCIHSLLQRTMDDLESFPEAASSLPTRSRQWSRAR